MKKGIVFYRLSLSLNFLRTSSLLPICLTTPHDHPLSTFLLYYYYSTNTIILQVRGKVELTRYSTCECDDIMRSSFIPSPPTSHKRIARAFGVMPHKSGVTFLPRSIPSPPSTYDNKANVQFIPESTLFIYLIYIFICSHSSLANPQYCVLFVRESGHIVTTL